MLRNIDLPFLKFRYKVDEVFFFKDGLNIRAIFFPLKNLIDRFKIPPVMRPCFALSACCLDRHPALKINNRDRAGTARLRPARAARAAPGRQWARTPDAAGERRAPAAPRTNPDRAPSPTSPPLRSSPGSAPPGRSAALGTGRPGRPGPLTRGAPRPPAGCGRGAGAGRGHCEFFGFRFLEPNSLHNISEILFLGGGGALRMEEGGTRRAQRGVFTACLPGSARGLGPRPARRAPRASAPGARARPRQGLGCPPGGAGAAVSQGAGSAAAPGSPRGGAPLAPAQPAGPRARAPGHGRRRGAQEWVLLTGGRPKRRWDF